MYELIVILFALFIYGNKVSESKPSILTTETAVQLKFYNNFINLWNDNNENTFKFKVSVIDVQQNNNESKAKSLLISILDDKNYEFREQQEFGHIYDSKEFVVLTTNVTNIEDVAYLIELFDTNSKLFGVSFILPFDKNITDGTFRTPIYDIKNKLIGRITVEFLIIRPIPGFDANVEKMIEIKRGVYMGHRGTGVGRRTDLPENFLENTIAAFNYACLHSADMIELDVQLSKEKIPIINHDFSVNVYLRKKSDNNFDVTPIPVKDITLAQMSEISTVQNAVFHKNDSQDNQPFETLKSVLEKVKPNCGINVEIKYPMKKKDGSMNGVKGLELNEYVDIIIKTLYESIGNRTAFITSFNPDLCSMIRLKQNQFAVALLTSGDVLKFNPKAIPYFDTRATTIPFGTYFAQSMKIHGLSVFAKDLLNDKNLINFVKSRNQSLYVWGDLLNSLEVIEGLKKDGVDGLIFDKIDKILNKNSH